MDAPIPTNSKKVLINLDYVEQKLERVRLLVELIRGANSPMTFPLFKDVDKALRNVVTEINEIETYVSLRKGSK